MTKHLLTKEQRAAGLDTTEDAHILVIVDTTTGKEIAHFGTGGVTIKEIQKTADEYLKGRVKVK